MAELLAWVPDKYNSDIQFIRPKQILKLINEDVSKRSYQT